ncbi:MmyB family transcriptional regulator [Microbacterium sp. No. 7]|uniref:MmyB family transcriptional regulator n=1 Tax=Microbacterium sp. No. 7 TaxID=1714373 RepID=UPI0006D1D51D|nr:helix-turn-helix domain-containing protein [Microbacterium sp. No. 7]ALJ21631.1 XRE family transcriptional regulator [Microbacterium sp. No. 7]
MPTSTELGEVGGFLRARREELRPEEVGIADADTARRRVRGLRREEVARLAAISPDYYARIEQGRLAPSPPVVDALIEVLRLDDGQIAYVRRLLSYPGREEQLAAKASPGKARVRPQIARLLDRFDRVPALVFGTYLDIVAWNPLAAELLIDFDEVPVEQRNYILLTFTDERMRARYPEWADVARTCVAVLRMAAAADPRNPELVRIVGELSLTSPEFRTWWAERRVAQQNFGTKTVRHPVAGDIRLDWDTFIQVGVPDQQLVLWSVEPGSESEGRLRMLEDVIAARDGAGEGSAGEG